MRRGAEETLRYGEVQKHLLLMPAGGESACKQERPVQSSSPALGVEAAAAAAAVVVVVAVVVVGCRRWDWRRRCGCDGCCGWCVGAAMRAAEKAAARAVAVERKWAAGREEEEGAEEGAEEEEAGVAVHMGEVHMWEVDMPASEAG